QPLDSNLYKASAELLRSEHGTPRLLQPALLSFSLVPKCDPCTLLNTLYTSRTEIDFVPTEPPDHEVAQTVPLTLFTALLLCTLIL
ncbi:MAG: hypothetical protein JWQ08_1574, partial [Deinococcus sp.]|nr:hypothetical protein [Deinococcus sp.]